MTSTVKTLFPSAATGHIRTGVDDYAKHRRRPPCTVFAVVDGQRVSLGELSRRTGLNYWTLYSRHARGLDQAKLLAPVDGVKSANRKAAV